MGIAVTLALVQLLFPGLKVAPAGRLEPQSTFLAGVEMPDALAASPVWIVTGPPSRVESNAALDLATREVNHQRRARATAFAAGAGRTLAVYSYTFAGVHDPASAGIAGIALIENGRVLSSLDLSAPGFTVFTSVRLRDLNGDGVPEAIVSRNRKGGLDTLILALDGGKIRKLLSKPSAVIAGPNREELTLDEDRTAAARARLFYFRKTTWHAGKRKHASVASVSFPADPDGGT